MNNEIKCAICQNEILDDSHFINGKYYHNSCIEQLQNNWNELKEDILYILEMIEHNKDVIKVTSDEELAIYSLQEKMQ